MVSVGAFLAAKEHVTKYLYYNARSKVFEKSLPMIITLGAIKRLEILKKSSRLRDKMWSNTNKLRTGLLNLGLNVGSGESPITPLFLNGTNEEAKNMLIDIRENHQLFA